MIASRPVVAVVNFTPRPLLALTTDDASLQVTAAVGKGLVTSDTGDLTTSLPANLLATEEAEQADTVSTSTLLSAAPRLAVSLNALLSHMSMQFLIDFYAKSE